MNNREWGFVLGLLVVSLATLMMVSPLQPAAGMATEVWVPTPTAQSVAAIGPGLALPTVTPTARPTATPTPTITPTPMPTAYPFDTRPDLDRFIYVDQLTQRMYVFQRGELLREILASTGLPTSTTTTEAWSGPVGYFVGTFTSFGVYADEAWYLYPCLGTILVHSLPYTWQDGVKVYQDRDALGVRPSSHGCIRISPEDAEWFSRWNPEGAYMVITEPYREYWEQQLSGGD